MGFSLILRLKVIGLYKGLNLNRNAITESIKRFFNLRGEECKVSDFKDKGSIKRLDIQYADSSIFLDFYFLNNGSTTINPYSGKEKELKIEMVKFIIDDPTCSNGDVHSKNNWLVGEGITREDFGSVIELLSESIHCEKCEEFDQNDKVKRYKLVGKQGDSVTIQFFSTGTMMIQGRPLALFNEASVYLTELVDAESISKMFNDYYKINIDKKNIENQYLHYLPNSHDKHNKKMKKVLLQAVYNLNLDGEMYEYSTLIFPGLRVLEGHLKKILNAHSIFLQNNKFSMFKVGENTTKYSLIVDNVLSDSLKNYFEDVYNFYNKHRHGLFHWNIEDEIDTTRTIDTLIEAKALIRDTLSKIDEYYTLSE